MACKQILYEPGPVVRLVMSRPRYHNAQSRVMLEEVDEAFEAAANDPEVRIVVLSGAGPSFSSGHDLGTPEELADRKERGFPAEAEGIYLHRRRLFVDYSQRWHTHAKPAIAMVHGYCTLGGWLIAAAMDLVFASQDAVFHPGRVLQWFTAAYDLGPRKAKEILFENRALTAQEAMDMGLVSRIYPPESLTAETMAYAARVAANDLMSNMMVKFSVNQALDAMGYSTTARSGYHTQFVSAAATPRADRSRLTQGRRQIRFVGDALERLNTAEDKLP